MMGAVAAMLPDGRRLHLQHGPIDLVIEAFGRPDAVADAYERARTRFAPVLERLAAELPLLRTPCGETLVRARDPIAQNMQRAAVRFAPAFITPMATVAGAVADAVLAATVAGDGLSRAYVNNGGDIALWLAPGARLDIGVIAPSAARLEIAAASPVRGIATSGRHGRSHSLGIADAVTVLARDAATADAAATLVANAVDLPGSAKIGRVPAVRLSPDSDLGDRLVTVVVDELSDAEIARALDRGERRALGYQRRGLIQGAVLCLGDRMRTVGACPLVSVGQHRQAACA